MNRIIKIGIDVHSTNYTLCALEPVIGAEDRVFANIQVTPDYKNILMFIQNLKCKLGTSDDYSIECGYEAGCLGYSLYNQLTSAGVKCVILAPTTMLTQQGKRVKTDARDALMIAQCLAYGGYHPVYIPTESDDSIKEYLRMRDDHKLALKKVKQQINAFCLRHGYHFTGTKWTSRHIAWLRELELSALYRETLDEYIVSYNEQTAKIERFDKDDMSDTPEISYTKINCTTKQTEDNYTGSRLLQLDKRGYYRITEVDDWSNSDYLFDEITCTDISKVSGLTDSKTISTQNQSAVIQLPRQYNKDSLAFPTSFGGLQTGSYPILKFTNKLNDYAYRTSQAYAENNIS